MAEKRKDSKKRSLPTGESERKDGTYMYRYTNIFKKRHTIYASTLNEFNDGVKSNSLHVYHTILRPAFEKAVNDDLIRKNPFDFSIDFLPKESNEKVALTQKEETAFLEFVKQNPQLCWYYDIYVRDIYIPDRANESLVRLIERRKNETNIEVVIDGYSNFLLILVQPSIFIPIGMGIWQWLK